MRTIIMMLAALMVAGCASSNGRIDRLESTIREQRELIAALQAERLTGVRAEPAATERDDTARVTPTEPSPRPASPTPVVRPMPRPVPAPVPMPVTPQHWGNLHGPAPVRGICSGVRSLHFVNRTDHFIAVQLDGRLVQMGGGGGILPFLPPNGRAEVCLSRLGRHTIAGELYDVSEGQPRSLGVRFSDSNVVFDESTYPYRHQRYLIDDSRIRRNRLR